MWEIYFLTLYDMTMLASKNSLNYHSDRRECVCFRTKRRLSLHPQICSPPFRMHLGDLHSPSQESQCQAEMLLQNLFQAALQMVCAILHLLVMAQHLSHSSIALVIPPGSTLADACSTVKHTLDTACNTQKSPCLCSTSRQHPS